MSLRAVVSYLDYRLKKDYEKQLFEIFVAEHLSIVASGRYTKEPNSYIEKERTELVLRLTTNSFLNMRKAHMIS